MRSLRASLLAVVLGILAAAPVASAAPATQHRDVSGFTQVQIKGALNATIREGSGFSVELTAEPSDQARIKTYVRGDTLVIDTAGADRRGWRSDRDASATITLPHFSGVAVNGAGDVTVDGVHANVAALTLQGAGSIHFSGEAKKVAVNLSGAGEVSFAPGHTESLNVTLSGAGEVKAKALVARTASVDLRGTGAVELTADGGPLSLGMHGIGSITWYGTSSAVSSNTGGIGSIQHG